MADPQTERLGTVRLDPPGAVRAGRVGTWCLTFTVGAYGIDEGGTIKLAQRFASDWEIPQFTDPAGRAFSTVSTDGNASVRARYDPKAHERPWMKCVVIDVYDGSLAPGDQVTIVLGETSAGSPGIRAQTFLESAHEFRVLVDPTNASLARRVPTSPTFPIVAGDAVSVVCVLPTNVAVDATVDAFVRGEDEWGNPTATPAGVGLTWKGTGECTVQGHRVTFRAPGEGRMHASWRDKTFASNPVVVGPPPELKHFWGDLHAQSDATVGTGNEVEYFTFARDSAHLDFASHQGNDFQMTDEDWHRLNAVTADFDESGRFVVFPGYEWSANSPAGGDRNVFYLEEGQPIIRSSHWQVPEVPFGALSPAHPVPELFRRIRDHVDLGKVILGAHVGGRFADIRRPEYFDDELGPLVEVASCWGVFEWLLEDALDAGYVVGVMCNSDGHKGRPGAEGPGAGQFGIGGGLTCVLAEELTRASIFEALRARRCYGTTGPRIALWFSADGHPMGSVLDAGDPVTLRARSVGGGPLEALELFRGRECIERVESPAFAGVADSSRIRVSWGGSRIRGRGRRVTWDGTVRVEGSRIVRVEPFAFDSPSDGIVEWDQASVAFRSRTTGDHDGLDLWLDEPLQGTLLLDTPVGRLAVGLEALGTDAVTQGFGGIDILARVRRYPEDTDGTALSLEATVPAPIRASEPYFVKVTQVDGHMAWSSPVYLRAPERVE